MFPQNLEMYDNNNSNITLNYIDYLHRNSTEAYVVIANKVQKVWKEKRVIYSKDNIINAIHYDSDCYITLNNFFTGRRTLQTLKEYTSFYIDIDCYKLATNLKLDFTKENVEYFKQKVIYELQKDYFKNIIPLPTFVIDSGRGIYLQWKINNVGKEYTKLWNQIQKILLNKLKVLGADSQSIDGARVLRLPGTVNTKINGGNVLILDFNDYIYDIEEISKFFEEDIKKIGEIKEIKKEEKKKKCIKEGNNKPVKQVKNTNRCVRIHNDRSLVMARIDDIESLCAMREYNIHLYNCRELTLFLYRYYLTKFSGNLSYALDKTLELNRKFTIPLEEARVLVDTESVARVFREGKEYKYSNWKLINILHITEEEQYKLTTIISTKVKNKRNNEKCKERNKKKRRNANGLTSREQSKQETINKVHKLKAEGYKQIEIAEALEITKGTVSKYLKLAPAEIEVTDVDIEKKVS